MSLREKIRDAIDDYDYGYYASSEEVATAILAAIEAERRSQTLDDLQQAGQVCDSEAAIRAAERERLAKKLESKLENCDPNLSYATSDAMDWAMEWIRSQE